MAVEAIKTVGVVGAGTMGNGIAHVLARSGPLFLPGSPL